MSSQFRNIGLPIPQGRHLDHHQVDAVKEVHAEETFFDGLFEIMIGRANDAHIDVDPFFAADALKRALLQNSQHLGLGRQRHVADFV